MVVRLARSGSGREEGGAGGLETKNLWTKNGPNQCFLFFLVQTKMSWRSLLTSQFSR